MKKSLVVILSIVLFVIFVCPTITKAVGPLTDEDRTLTSDGPVPVLPVSHWTPASKFYGLKIFWEDANQLVRSIFSKQSEIKYLSYRMHERYREQNKMKQLGITDEKYIKKTADLMSKESKEMEAILNTEPSNQQVIGIEKEISLNETYNTSLKDHSKFLQDRMNDLNSQIDVAKKAGNDAKVEVLNQQINEAQKEHNLFDALYQARQREEQDRLKEAAKALPVNDSYDLLSNWAKTHKDYFKNLEALKVLDPDAYAKAAQKLDEFNNNLKNSKDSGKLSADQIDNSLKQIQNELAQIDQENQKILQEAQNKEQPAAEQKVEQPKPAPVTEKQPVVTPPQPQPEKKVLKKIPSESVKREPLVLHYGKQLFGQVNQKFAFTFTGSGGLPPYHFQLGTGGGFPSHGLVLAPSGLLSGTPTAEGDSSFSVCVVDTAGANVCAPVAMTIYPAQPEPEPEPEPETALAVTLDTNHCDVVSQVTNATGTYTFYHWWMRGTASGPVRSKVEITWRGAPSAGLISDCGDWTNDYGYCVRSEGQPAITTWTFGWPENHESNIGSNPGSGEIKVTTPAGNVQKVGWSSCR